MAVHLLCKTLLVAKILIRKYGSFRAVEEDTYWNESLPNPIMLSFCYGLRIIRQDSTDSRSKCQCRLPSTLSAFKRFEIVLIVTMSAPLLSSWTSPVFTSGLWNGQEIVDLKLGKLCVLLSIVPLTDALSIKYCMGSKDDKVHTLHDATRKILQPLSSSLSCRFAVHVYQGIRCSHSVIASWCWDAPEGKVFLS